MLFARSFLYVTIILLLTQTPSIHGISIFGYEFDTTSRLSALYSHVQSYMWGSWSNNSRDEGYNTPSTVPTIAQSAINNFSQLCDNLIGWYTIKTILSLYPDSTPAFVPAVINNFSQMCNSRYGYNILQAIFRYYPEAVPLFIQPIVDNLSQICNSKYGRKFLKDIVKDSANTTLLLTECMAKTPDIFYPFSDLIEYKTQTKQHLITHMADKYKELSSQGSTNYQDFPDLQNLTKQIIDREYVEQLRGRYTFVHAHHWSYHFYQELYTNLWGIIHEQPSNYRFLRYKYPSKPSTDSFFAHIEQEQKKRSVLLSEGPGDYYVLTGQQEHLLFMNYALFVNPGFSNTGYYIKDNSSAFPPSIDCTQFIKELPFDQYLTQDELAYLEIQLTELQAEHESASNYGGALLLSFTPELMKGCVYPCRGMGPKRTVKIEDVGETSDPQAILDTLRTAPEKIKDSDNIEFVCILSHDSTLIPHNGLDIYEFNAADQDKLATWRAKKDTLMAWIKERVDKRRQALTAQATAPQMKARL